MKDKVIREVLFGRNCKITGPDKSRSSTFIFPGIGDDEMTYQYEVRGDDGFILHLIKMIEDLKKRMNDVEFRVKTPPKK